ncbi:MAG: GNAT family N-acetyltransferase [Pseudomonadota bacterium]
MAEMLETERLRLIPLGPEHVEPHVAYLSSERSHYVGGNKPRDDAWRTVAMLTGHWVLRGCGPWALIQKATSEMVGLVGPWYPEGWPEREMSWSVYAKVEGKGYAREAAIAAREHAYNVLGWDTAVSYIDPENTRSIALAERLGCQLDPKAAAPEKGAPILVYRHPSPEALR